MANLICPTCKVRERGSQSYCKECFAAYKAKLRAARISAMPAKQCSECGSDFRSSYQHAVTCSTECGAERERRLRGTQVRIAELDPRSCEWCSTLFAPKNTLAKYCCARCNTHARNARRAQPGGRRNRPSRSLRARVGEVEYARILERRAVHKAEAHQLARLRWAAANGERIANARRARYAANPLKANENTRRYRARKTGAATMQFTRAQLSARLEVWGGKCWMCGAPATSVDHVKPLIAGGPHILANFRPACGSCNSAKGGRWHGVAELHQFTRI